MEGTPKTRFIAVLLVAAAIAVSVLATSHGTGSTNADFTSAAWNK